MIVGLGAVGGYALEGIARAGVGRLILVDFDSFDETNINRQILALTSTIGRKKTAVAYDRVKEINPDCDVKIKDCFVCEENLEALLDEKIDFVIDAIDTIKPKCDLMEKLYQKNIPFISSMGAALKTDCSSIRQDKLSKTLNCPMARTVRQNLKKRGVKIEKIDCVFSAEQAKVSQSCIQETAKGEKNILGSLPTITAIFGMMMSGHLIEKITQGK